MHFSLFTSRCPACCQGALYAGWLSLAPQCAVCGLSFGQEDVGDGPAFGAIVVAGFLVTLGAVIVELAYGPPLWLHALIWIPATLLSVLFLLRMLKTALLHWQYRTGRLN